MMYTRKLCHVWHSGERDWHADTPAYPVSDADSVVMAGGSFPLRGGTDGC